MLQLAHGSPTACISGFSNVQQLYEKIATELGISVDEVRYFLNVKIICLLLHTFFEYFLDHLLHFKHS